MKRFTLTLIIAIAISTGTYAQSQFDVTYSIGFGTGDLGSFISEASFRGIAFDYRYEFVPNMAFGFNTGWNTFYSEKPSDTYTSGNISLTGKQYRYSNSLPMLATYSYSMSPGQFVSPFATLGLGTMYVKRNTDMNLYTLEEEGWPFVLQPQIGIRFNNWDAVSPVISLKYLHGFQAGDFNADQSYLTLNLGFSFR